jgi:predicted RNA-binding protein
MRVQEIWGFLFHGIWFLSCVITCSDFYTLSNQINLFMVINIWGIIIYIYCMLVREIWKFIHPRVSYSLRATPEGNMILVDEYFSRQSYRSLTGKRQRHSERIIFWDNVPMDWKYACLQYFTCMCFLDFIRYNKTLIAYGFRKYENVFIHEYHNCYFGLKFNDNTCCEVICKRRYNDNDIMTTNKLPGMYIFF